jgi:hypothetical protein
VRVLRVPVQQLGQPLDLLRLPRDLLAQRGELRVALGESRLAQRDTRTRLGILPVVSLVANRHMQLGSRSNRHVHPSRAKEDAGG